MVTNPVKLPVSWPGEQPILLGLDIGGTKTGVVLGALDGQILERVEFPTLASEPYPVAREQMLKTADGLLATARQAGIAQPQAVSVSVGGPLNIRAGVILSPPHLPTWVEAPLKADLQSHFQLPVLIEHDGNAGALAEFYFGAGRGAKNLIFLTMGTGIGAGIILDGKIYRGTTDMAGEVGHIRVSEQGPEEYGKVGAWEGYCSGAGIAKLAHLYQPGQWPKQLNTQQVVESALAGEPRALALIEHVGEWLGKGIAILVDILNPEVVIVGTLGVVLGDLLLDPARRVMKSEALAIAAQACRITPAQLGSSLGNVSALVAAIDGYHTGQWAPAGSKQYPNQQIEIITQSLLSGIEVRTLTTQRLTQGVADTASLLEAGFRKGGKVIAFGNGGSAAAAQHLVGELMGRFKAERQSLPAVALNADSSVITCIGNDYAFDEIFARQVRALARPEDLVIGFTTSGRSANVLLGLQAAQEKGAHTIALTGEAGLATPVADHLLAVPSSLTARIQEEHEAIIHAWCTWIDRVFANEN